MIANNASWAIVFWLLICTLSKGQANYGRASSSSQPLDDNCPPKINQLRIIHTNDIHAHLDEFNSGGNDCKASQILSNTCYGGIARIRTAVDTIRKQDKDVLFFDAGDQFQGTLFYTMFKGAKIAEFMNDIKYDLMCIGNHEFDDGEKVLYEFFQKLKFPVVSSNIDMNTTLYLHKIVQPYVVLEKYNIGVIGFITNLTRQTTRGAMNLTFYDPVGPVQRTVDILHKKGVRKIIAVSHNGYGDDIRVAANTYGINLIVGGHSHSLLLKNQSISGVVGRYPTPVKNLRNDLTYIVQAHRWGDYLGNVLVKWNDNEELVSVQGDPILLDQTVPKHNETAVKVATWRRAFDGIGNEIIGQATSPFGFDCKGTNVCPLAELITDAMLEAHKALGADLAMTNSGGIRAGFPSGNLTYQDAATILPFGDALVHLTMKGSEIMAMLEASAAMKNQPDRGGGSVLTTARWSGLRCTVNMSAPIFRRVSGVTVRNRLTAVFTPLDLLATYTTVVNDFVVIGGDNIIYPPVSNEILTDNFLDVFVAYIRATTPVSPTSDGRLTVV